MILYHFTSPWHRQWIEEDGYLTPTESNLHPTVRNHGPDVVWMTDQAAIEQGSNGLLRLDPSHPDKTQVRFTLDVPDHIVRRWLPWADGNGIDQHWKHVLIKAGGGLDVAEHWWVAFRRIPSSMWKAVEVRPEGGWS